MLLLQNNDRQRVASVYKEFGRQVIAPRAAQLYSAGEFDHTSWQELAELGFWRIAVPRQYDGKGGTWQDFATALEGLACTASDLGFLLSIIAHAGLVRAISEFATDEQRDCWLHPLLQGDIGATSLTEATGGSDMTSIQTSATETSCGYILHGEKTHITNAPIADKLLVLGRIPALGKHVSSQYWGGSPNREHGLTGRIYSTVC